MLFLLELQVKFRNFIKNDFLPDYFARIEIIGEDQLF